MLFPIGTRGLIGPKCSLRAKTQTVVRSQTDYSVTSAFVNTQRPVASVAWNCILILKVLFTQIDDADLKQVSILSI